ncbi:DNA repair protein RecO [Eubacteriaceae bacterium ES2]|nr:DNA repair protein RecO [Eubacteriaceae bacterium ES2]
MGLIETKGIIIKEMPYRDQDKILTVFTEREGKIQCIARGVRRPKSPLLASTQVFAYSDLVYYPGKTFGNIQQAHLIESFYALRNDLNKVALGSYLLDLVNNSFEVYQESPEILKLLLHCLYYLSENKAKNDLVIVAAFQIKLVSFLGYRPGLSACMHCQNQQDLFYFDIEASGLACGNCRQPDHYTYRINPKLVNFLKDLLAYPVKQLKDLVPEEELVEKAMDILEHYIGNCIGKASKAYGFYKDMKNLTI